MENNLEIKVLENLEPIKTNIDGVTNVTEEQVASSLDYNNLTVQEKAAIDEFVGKIDEKDTNVIISFGSPAQTKISQFSDEILKSVRTKDLGQVGNLLADLAGEIKSFDGGINVNMKPSLFNSIKKQINRILAKFSKVETNINKIEKQLEGHKVQMMKDIAIFDEMYEKNIEYFKELSLYIIAGNKKLDQIRNEIIPALHDKAEKTGEQNDVQAYNDMINIANRFEKKLYDLKTTRIISIQMAPQIRLIQNNDAELVDKIQSSIINTIPLWKNQMVIALGLTNASRALDAQEKVTNLTNDMLKKNSEILKQGSIKIAQESERAVVDLETVKKTNQDLMDTIESIIKIHEEGSQKRAQAENELNKIENDLKAKLLELKA